MCQGEYLPDLVFEQGIHTEGEKGISQKVQQRERGQSSRQARRVGQPMERSPLEAGGVDSEDQEGENDGVFF